MDRRKLLKLGVSASVLAIAGPGTVAIAQDQALTMVSIPKVRAPWFNQFELGLERGGEDFGVSVNQQAPASADEALQVRLVEDAISQGVNALIVVPNNAATLVPAFTRAKEQGIAVLTHESPGQEGADIDIELIDNEAFGAAAMDLLAERMGSEGGKIVVFVGSLTVPAHNIWADAALARAKEAYPGIELIAERFPVSEDQSLARQTTLDILTANPDLKGVLAFGSQGAPGAAQAVQERGMAGNIAVIGTTSPNQAAQYIENGSMSGCILWDPGEAAYAMVWLAQQILDGADVLSADTDIPGLGKPMLVEGNTLIYNRPLIVTAENLAENNTF